MLGSLLILALGVTGGMTARLGFPAADKLAQNLTPFSDRPPTAPEIQRLIPVLRQKLDQALHSPITLLYRDQRSLAQTHEINQFIRQWSKRDPAIAPFLGKRQITTDLLIYPSLTRGQVCIIQSYFRDEHSHGTVLIVGQVRGKYLQTDAHQTWIELKGYLGEAIVRQGTPQVELWPLPTPLVAPDQILYLQHSPLLSRWKALGCTAELPPRG